MDKTTFAEVTIDGLNYNIKKATIIKIFNKSDFKNDKRVEKFFTEEMITQLLYKHIRPFIKIEDIEYENENILKRQVSIFLLENR